MSDYDELPKLVFIGIGLYILFFPITIPVSIYYALTEKPYIPPKPVQETEQQRAAREEKTNKFKFRKESWNK